MSKPAANGTRMGTPAEKSPKEGTLEYRDAGQGHPRLFGARCAGGQHSRPNSASPSHHVWVYDSGLVAVASPPA
jgi:hypothetical protein